MRQIDAAAIGEPHVDKHRAGARRGDQLERIRGVRSSPSDLNPQTSQHPSRQREKRGIIVDDKHRKRQESMIALACQAPPKNVG